MILLFISWILNQKAVHTRNKNLRLHWEDSVSKFLSRNKRSPTDDVILNHFQRIIITLHTWKWSTLIGLKLVTWLTPSNQIALLQNCLWHWLKIRQRPNRLRSFWQMYSFRYARKGWGPVWPDFAKFCHFGQILCKSLSIIFGIISYLETYWNISARKLHFDKCSMLKWPNIDHLVTLLRTNRLPLAFVRASMTFTTKVFSRMRWTTGSAQWSNMCGMWLCVSCSDIWSIQ